MGSSGLLIGSEILRPSLDDLPNLFMIRDLNLSEAPMLFLLALIEVRDVDHAKFKFIFGRVTSVRLICEHQVRARVNLSIEIESELDCQCLGTRTENNMSWEEL